jgi:hypothetical protein
MAINSLRTRFSFSDVKWTQAYLSEIEGIAGNYFRIFCRWTVWASANFKWLEQVVVSRYELLAQIEKSSKANVSYFNIIIN